MLTQDMAEREVQHVGCGVVCHARQPPGLRAKTGWQGVLVLHSSGEQGWQEDRGKAAHEGMGRQTMGSTAVRLIYVTGQI